MPSVNVAKLKDRLSEYLRIARGGEEVIIRDRNLPVAKLVPFRAEGASEEELKWVAEGKIRLPEMEFNRKMLGRLRGSKLNGNKGIEALLEDREESP